MIVTAYGKFIPLKDINNLKRNIPKTEITEKRTNLTISSSLIFLNFSILNQYLLHKINHYILLYPG